MHLPSSATDLYGPDGPPVPLAVVGNQSAGRLRYDRGRKQGSQDDDCGIRAGYLVETESNNRVVPVVDPAAECGAIDCPGRQNE